MQALKDQIASININVTGVVTWHHEPAPLPCEGLVNQVYATKYWKTKKKGGFWEELICCYFRSFRITFV